ncbi:MAG: UDP-glucose/GDP-mannose dehydrogenase family protein [Xanthomonadales bacterium]|nr:UDP-glucose/GDP-mannose dehydrogenase family protein [Xanthomonadales bacterium]
MNVTIFGSGYVGLVTGACMADAGNKVLCMDVDQGKIDRLNQGEIPIYEPGLQPLIASNAEAGRLRFTYDAAAAVNHGEFQFIAVGTPPDEDGSADLSHVLAVASTIGQHMTEPKIIVNKSTVPVGTAEKVRVAVEQQLAARGVELEFRVVSNPEFLKEGAAIEDCMKPDRIVVGTDCDEALDRMKELYSPFNRNHEKVIAMDVRSAELTKYAANAMLATKISFMNEMANLAEQVGADVEHVRLGIGSDPRIGFSFIYPGCGYGGSCFPKDVQALARTSDEHGYHARILESVEAVNADQKTILFSKILQHYGGDISGKTFALWGLAFKPNTDDMREAPSRNLMEALWQAGARVRAFDPQAAEETRRIYGDRPDLDLCQSAEEAVQGADGLILVTEWKSFWSPDFDLLQRELSQPVIFDGRNIYDPAALARRGFHYYGIGRGLSVEGNTD